MGDLGDAKKFKCIVRVKIKKKVYVHEDCILKIEAATGVYVSG